MSRCRYSSLLLRLHRVQELPNLHIQNTQNGIGNDQLLRKLQAMETALEHNAKIVVPAGADLVNVIGEMAGIVPLVKDKAKLTMPPSAGMR